jgi:hypothetical protein
MLARVSSVLTTAFSASYSASWFIPIRHVVAFACALRVSTGPSADRYATAYRCSGHASP